jgi:hypothetical protein
MSACQLRKLQQLEAEIDAQMMADDGKFILQPHRFGVSLLGSFGSHLCLSLSLSVALSLLSTLTLALAPCVGMS